MFDVIKNIVLSGWGSTVVLGLMTVAFGAAFRKYRRLAKEIYDVAVKYHAITDEKSPGGKSMTPEEKDAFVKEIMDVVEAGGALIEARRNS